VTVLFCRRNKNKFFRTREAEETANDLTLHGAVNGILHTKNEGIYPLVPCHFVRTLHCHSKCSTEQGTSVSLVQHVTEKLNIYTGHSINL